MIIKDFEAGKRIFLKEKRAKADYRGLLYRDCPTSQNPPKSQACAAKILHKPWQINNEKRGHRRQGTSSPQTQNPLSPERGEDKIYNISMGYMDIEILLSLNWPSTKNPTDTPA